MLQRYTRVIGLTDKEANTQRKRNVLPRRYQSPAKIGSGVRKAASQGKELVRQDFVGGSCRLLSAPVSLAVQHYHGDI